MSDVNGFPDLVRAHLDSLYGYALVLARHREDAEDLVHESLLAALESFDRFDRTRSFKAWMFTILKRTHIDRVRRDHAHPVVPELPAADGESQPISAGDDLCSIPLAPDDILARRESIEHVRGAIRGLPSVFREIVELRDIEGFSYDEIARITNVPRGTVMSRLFRGRNLVRNLLVEPPAVRGRPA